MADTVLNPSWIMEVLRPQMDLIRNKRSVRISLMEFPKSTKLADICNAISDILERSDTSTKLEKILVSNNALVLLPGEFYRLCGPQLRSLDVHGNKLTDIPIGIAESCPNLEILDMSQNEISRLSTSALSSLRKLRFLLVRDNRVTHLPTVLGEMLSLESLEFSHNPLVFPPSDVLQSIQGGTNELKAYLVAADLYKKGEYQSSESDASGKSHRSERLDSNPGQEKNDGTAQAQKDHVRHGGRRSDEGGKLDRHERPSQEHERSQETTKHENNGPFEAKPESYLQEHTLDPRADVHSQKHPATSPRPLLPSTPALLRTRSLSDTHSRSLKASRRMGLIINSNKVTPDKNGALPAMKHPGQIPGNVADSAALAAAATVANHEAATPSKPARKLLLPNRDKSEFSAWMDAAPPQNEGSFEHNFQKATSLESTGNGNHSGQVNFPHFAANSFNSVAVSAASAAVSNDGRNSQRKVPGSPKSASASASGTPGPFGASNVAGTGEEFPIDVFTEAEQKPTAYFRRLSILQETPVETAHSRSGSDSSTEQEDVFSTGGQQTDHTESAERSEQSRTRNRNRSQSQSQNQSQSQSQSQGRSESQSRVAEAQPKATRKVSFGLHTARPNPPPTSQAQGKSQSQPQSQSQSQSQGQNTGAALRSVQAGNSGGHEKAVIVKVSRKILFAFSELHLSIKRFAGFCGDRKLSSRILRLIHSSKEHIDDLVEAMEAVEDGKENQNSVVFFLHACIGSFKTILATISENFAALVAKIDACFIRMVILTLYGSLHELQNAHCLLAPSAGASPAPHVSTSTQPTSSAVPVPAGVPVPAVPASGVGSTGLGLARAPATLKRNTSGLNLGASSVDLRAKFAQASQGILDDMPLETPSISSASEAVATLEEIDERLYQTIGLATDNAQVVFSELTKTISKLAMESATSKTGPTLNATVTAKFKELTHVCMTLMDITKRLVGKLSAIRQNQDPATRRLFWDDINLFLKAVIQTFSAVKDIMRDAPIFNEVRWSMANLTKTTKELTIILEASSYKAISDAVETQNGNSNGMWHMSSGPPAAANANAVPTSTTPVGNAANTGNAANPGSAAAATSNSNTSANAGPASAGIPAVRTPLVATVGTAAAQALLAQQSAHAKVSHVTTQLPPLHMPPLVFTDTSNSGLHTAPVQSMEQYYAKNVNPFDRM